MSSITVESLRGSMFTLAGDYLLYGLYILLFSSTVIVVHRRRKVGYRLHSASIISLFLLATTGLAVDSYGKVVNISWILLPDIELSRLRGLVRILLVTFLVADVIADVVLIFRCYIIWGSKKRVIIFPVCMLLANIIYAVVSIAIDTPHIPSDPSAAVPQDISTAQAVELGLIAFENTLLTALIVGRIWWHAQDAGVFIGFQAQKIYRAVIAILLESGVLYTSALIACLIFSISVRNAATIDLTAMLIQTVGIASTLIVLRSTLGISVDRSYPASSLSFSRVGNTSDTQSFSLNRLS